MKAMPLKNRHLFTADGPIIFSIGKMDPWGQGDGSSPGFPIRAMQSYLDTLAEAGIDTLLMCTNYNVAYYPSKVWPSITDGYTRGDRDFFTSDEMDGVTNEDKSKIIDEFVDMYDTAYDLREAGIDWLAEVASCCRRSGIAPWLNIRMNDIHGATDPRDWPNSPFEGRPDRRQKNTFVFPHQNALGIRVGLDYGLPEVRDHMLALIRELISDYDYEGIEFDWMREGVS